MVDEDQAKLRELWTQAKQARASGSPVPAGLFSVPIEVRMIHEARLEFAGRDWRRVKREVRKATARAANIRRAE